MWYIINILLPPDLRKPNVIENRFSMHLVQLEMKMLFSSSELISLYIIQTLLVKLLVTSLLQRFAILLLIYTLRGNLPSSPYTMHEGVVLFMLRIILQNFKWSFSTISLFSKPQISQP